MIDYSALEGIGLTKGEIKAYLALLELGPSTTGDIISKAEVSRSKVYEMLERLMKRGLVSFVIKENIKYFEAAAPGQIIEYIEKSKRELNEKEAQIRSLLPELKRLQGIAKVPQSATVYEGVRGIQTLYQDVLATLQKGESYQVVAVEEEILENKEFLRFIMQHHKKRVEKGISVNLLAPSRMRDLVAKTVGKTALLNARFIDQEIPAATLVYKDKVATFVWAKTPTGVMIRSPTIAKRYQDFFTDLWKRAKP